MLAVPFYFITSGYLIQSKINLKPTASLKQEYLRYRARKIARLWFIWLAISLPLAIWSYSNRASASFDIVSDVKELYTGRNYQRLLTESRSIVVSVFDVLDMSDL